jgi:biopolymer transport protein ExbD
MGITGPGGPQKGAMSEPNIVPLIDILLVLIIIFMVVTPLTPKGLDALVPQPPPPDQKVDIDVQQRTVVIQVECPRVTCTGTSGTVVKINEEPHSWDTLGPRLNQIFKERAEKVAFVKGSDNLEFAAVAQAIDIAKGQGIDKIGLITAKIEMGE